MNYFGAQTQVTLNMQRERRNVIPAHCYSSVCFPLIIRETSPIKPQDRLYKLGLDDILNIHNAIMII